MAADITAIETRTTPQPRRVALPYALLTLLALLIIWQLATVLFALPAYLLPSPLRIVQQIQRDWLLLISHGWVTLLEIVAGFIVSVLIGVPIAIWVTYSKAFDEAVYPLIVGSQTIPKVALAPLLLAWFGFGVAPKIIIVVLVAFFPVVINAVMGLRSAPVEMLHLARSMGATPMQIFWRFRLPQALPSIFAGMKLAIVLAVIGAVVAEFVGSDVGLGYLIMIAGANFDIARQFAAIVVLSMVGMALFWVASRAERMCLPWHVSIRTRQD
jgi:NitT/TauT family transport system permease protein